MSRICSKSGAQALSGGTAACNAAGVSQGVCDAVKRSRAKRWGRLLDLQTWPEVLRRYCLATRAGLPMSEEQLRSLDVAAMTADEVAVHAALRLGRTGWWMLSPPLHTRLLSTLCDDISQGARLRTEIAARCEEASQLHVRPSPPRPHTCVTVAELPL